MIFLQIGFAYSDFFNSKQMTEFQQYCKTKFVELVFEKFKNNKVEPNPNDVMSKILRTQHILADWYSKIFSYVVPISLQLIITTVYLLSIDVQLGIYLFVLLCIFASFIFNSNNICNKNNELLDEQSTKINDGIGDIITNYLSVYKEQSLNLEMNILKNDFKKYKTYHNETILCTIKYRLMLSTVIIIFITLFVKRCYKLLKTNQIQNAIFYSVFMILANLISNMVYMIDMHRDMVFDWGLIKNSGFDKIDKMPVIKYDCTNPVIDKDAVLEIKNLYYKFESKNHYTLSNINLKVMPKERLAVTGHIGSGKSTLMKIILRLLYPEKGTILLKQKCVYDMGVKEYFKMVGFMPQNCLLFKRSILENIMYSNKSLVEEDIMKVIKKHNLLKHFKNGLNVGTDSLSGGQRQLVWFLRIYFKNPEVILLDEPTASLDKETKDLFIHLMNTMLKDKTIIIITHDQYLLKFVSRAVDINVLQG
jgi:ABC-type multidrug transport system fused ATPase/permease subunit